MHIAKAESLCSSSFTRSCTQLRLHSKICRLLFKFWIRLQTRRTETGEVRRYPVVIVEAVEGDQLDAVFFGQLNQPCKDRLLML